MSTHFNILNPFTQELLYKVPWSTEQELINSINKISKETSNTTIQERAQVLERLSIILDNNRIELSKLIALETGKPLTDGLLEIQRACLLCKNVSQELTALKGEVYFSTSSYYGNIKPAEKYCLSSRTPYGIVLAIVPFNFPVNLALHKIAPAYAMGNTLLVKPHPQCFETTNLLISLCYKAGMTDNDIQWIYPDNVQTQKLLSHEKIDLISFTGGTQTAKIISAHCGIKKTLFELGGNDALVVFPDADLKKVSTTIITQRFRCAGQRCTSPKRIFLHKKIQDELKTKLLKDLKNFKSGDPLDQSTDIGPVINKESKNNIISKIEKSIFMGARAINSWSTVNNMIDPVILENVNLEMPVVMEETFGPVASLVSFDNESAAINMINKSNLGLQCGVFTQNLDMIKLFYAKVRAGSIIANEGPAYRLDHFPFGGFKESGTGREGSYSALMEFSCSKNLIF